jgi:hypothetical protein
MMVNIMVQIRMVILSQQKKMSQMDLEKYVGYRSKGRYISSIERGLSTIPLLRAKRFMEVLEISPEDMVAALGGVLR